MMAKHSEIIPMYAQITPDRLATRSLGRAADAFEGVAGDPTLWFFVILDLNRALYAALVAALSAENFDEAYSPKLQIHWKQFWEDSRTDPNAQSPTSNRVPYLPELIEMAQTAQLLHLTNEQQAHIVRLNEWRDNLEHVKPDSWSLETTDLPRIVRNVAVAFGLLFDRFQHHLEENEVERTKFVLDRLKAAAD
jgi:hypothetical protein